MCTQTLLILAACLLAGTSVAQISPSPESLSGSEGETNAPTLNHGQVRALALTWLTSTLSQLTLVGIWSGNEAL